jgi:seryl-tRNA synthetase
MTIDFDPQRFHDDLVRHGFIVPTGVPGGYGRAGAFEEVVDRFNALVSRISKDDGAEIYMFPPVVSRALIERVGYMDNFPQLCGSISSFFGSEADAKALSAAVLGGERWDHMLSPTDLMLTPAACYPVYPVFTGLLPGPGRLVSMTNWVFRHEPSAEPTRLQAFRQREFVRVGTPDQVVAWRNDWLDRAMTLLAGLGLPVRSDVASDAFFGRAGRMMAASQRDQRLKFEVLVPVIAADKPTAICSFNWHQDHFSSVFDIRSADGSVASTACLGFGLERVTLALIRHHGFDLAAWPAEVRAQLWP